MLSFSFGNTFWKCSFAVKIKQKKLYAAMINAAAMKQYSLFQFLWDIASSEWGVVHAGCNL